MYFVAFRVRYFEVITQHDFLTPCHRDRVLGDVHLLFLGTDVDWSLKETSMYMTGL